MKGLLVAGIIYSLFAVSLQEGMFNILWAKSADDKLISFCFPQEAGLDISHIHLFCLLWRQFI